MANYGKRLSMVSIDGEDPTITFDDGDWSQFEAVFGSALNERMRGEITEICNWHLSRQWVENLAEPQQWVIDRAVAAKKKVEPVFRFLAEDLGHHEGDAHGAFTDQLEEFMANQTFRLREPALFKHQSDTGQTVEVEDWGTYVVKPSVDLTLELVSSVMVALELVLRGDGLDSGGFEQGTAYKGFLLKMREWAKKFDFHYGPYRGAGEGGQPSNLSRLIFELTQRFPDELRTKIKGDGAAAVAKRLKRAMEDKREAEKMRAEDETN